jgi:isopentenyl-diphosphate delta-isomerase
LADRGTRPLHETVSDDSEKLILVDSGDRAVGSLSKAECHDGDGVLHRAFSIFVFNDAGELLLQRRSADKRLWPLYWSNSCCSHPRLGESMEEATQRRLAEELGMSSDLRPLFAFEYHARFGDLGSEHELCHVFAGTSDDPVRANATEIAEWRWITPERLDHEMRTRPEIFTPWFALEWPRVRDLQSEVVGA